jgi:ribosomal protein L15E
MSQTNRVVRRKTNARKNPHGANHLVGGLRWIVVGIVRQRELRGLTKSG